jgi:hypothetical protein
MWITILILGILWLLWRRWVRFWRSNIARINMMTAAAMSHSDGWPSVRPNPSESAEENNRVVRCERCGVYVPANEVKHLPQEAGAVLPRYCCITPCESEAKL